MANRDWESEWTEIIRKAGAFPRNLPEATDEDCRLAYREGGRSPKAAELHRRASEARQRKDFALAGILEKDAAAEIRMLRGTVLFVLRAERR